MTEHILVGISSIIILGIAAQWLAWRLGLPSILVLLLTGFIVGPILGFLQPDELLGDLLFPIVSISVALILFEGGLTLRIVELSQTRHVVRNLVTVGALVTWVLATTAAYFILGLSFPLALLFGAILVVTGPTVIIPLLRHIRAVGRVGSVAKWEGIVNDPIGALLAVLVFEATLTPSVQESTLVVIMGLLTTIITGAILGGVGAFLLILLLKRYWIPDHLQTSITLMIVVGAFTLSNVLQKESGLFTVTLMGIILANQKQVSVKHIMVFKENLGVLLLSSLFIILSARLRLADLTFLGLRSFSFLAFLILIVRPVAVLLSTISSGLNWKEKLFLSWMAPRGVVAAAVTAVFALELAERAGYGEAERMVPQMFFIIVGTVTIYGLSAAPLGRWLGVAQPNPQGTLIIGAHPWARTIATVLQESGFEVLLLDTNRENVNAAHLASLPTVQISALSEAVYDELELGSFGRLLALTSNDEVNALASLHFAEIFGRARVYQLATKEKDGGNKEAVSPPLRGRLLFDSHTTYADLAHRFETGAVIKKTILTKQFDYAAFKQQHYSQNALPLFLITQTGNLIVFTTDNKYAPQPGDTIISLVSLTQTLPDEEVTAKSVPIT